VEVNRNELQEALEKAKSEDAKTHVTNFFTQSRKEKVRTVDFLKEWTRYQAFLAIRYLVFLNQKKNK